MIEPASANPPITRKASNANRSIPTVSEVRVLDVVLLVEGHVLGIGVRTEQPNDRITLNPEDRHVPESVLDRSGERGVQLHRERAFSRHGKAVHDRAGDVADLWGNLLPPLERIVSSLGGSVVKKCTPIAVMGHGDTPWMVPSG